MDERQAQIKEGAGLEESRVNQELIDFLNKWSYPVLLLVAIVSGGYFVFNQYQVRTMRKQDDAFAQLGNIESSASPSVFSLTTIADEFDGVKSVSELALLRAAEIHFNASRSGVDPNDPETMLSEDDVAFHLTQAGELFGRVADRVAGDPDRVIFAVNAAFGLAAVAESQGDYDTASSQYTKAETLAEENGVAPLAKVAADFAASAGEITDITLYEREQLPRMPFEPEPLEATTEVVDDDAEAGSDDEAQDGAGEGTGDGAGTGDGEPSDDG